MKKQTQIILSSILVFISVIVGNLAYSNTALADTGACSQKAAYNDKCMNINQAKTPLSVSDFNSIVHACEGRDSLGAAAPTGYANNSESGSCSNAVASCYSKVLDTRVCKNDSYLAEAAGTNDGEISGEDWDKTIDNVNKYTGGEDLNSNKGTKAAREDAYNSEIGALCDARGSATGAEACKKSLEKSFNDCYDSLGGDHANVSDSALKSCTNGKRVAAAQNKAECEAAGGTWNQTTGPITGKRCTPGADPVAQPKTCADGSTPDANGKCADGSTATTPPPGPTTPKPGDAGTCGQAKTNLITCDGNGCEDSDKNNGVACLGNVLKIVLFILTVLIGIVATGGIVYGAILYASAQDNASQVGQAKTIIRDVVIGLLLYGFMVAIVNWLVPGMVIG